MAEANEPSVGLGIKGRCGQQLCNPPAVTGGPLPLLPPRPSRLISLDVLLRGRMADIAVARDWELLREVARLAQQDAQIALASTDPALFSSWRAAVTKYHLKGWTHMTPERVDTVRDRANSYKNTSRIA